MNENDVVIGPDGPKPVNPQPPVVPVPGPTPPEPNPRPAPVGAFSIDQLKHTWGIFVGLISGIVKVTGYQDVQKVFDAIAPLLSSEAFVELLLMIVNHFQATGATMSFEDAKAAFQQGK